MTKANTAVAAAATNAAATPAPAAERPDPFKGLKTITVGEDKAVIDTTSLPVSNPRKYEKVHAAAVAGKLPTQENWKHSRSMFLAGTNAGGENGFRQGSVYGTIREIAKAAGSAGISSQAMATELRRRQIGNKRSHFCENLPPVGWAEGWINTAVTKNIIKVDAKNQAPALVIPAPAPAEDGGAKKAS